MYFFSSIALVGCLLSFSSFVFKDADQGMINLIIYYYILFFLPYLLSYFLKKEKINKKRALIYFIISNSIFYVILFFIYRGYYMTYESAFIYINILCIFLPIFFYRDPEKNYKEIKKEGYKLGKNIKIEFESDIDKFYKEINKKQINKNIKIKFKNMRENVEYIKQSGELDKFDIEKINDLEVKIKSKINNIVQMQDSYVKENRINISKDVEKLEKEVIKVNKEFKYKKELDYKMKKELIKKRY